MTLIRGTKGRSRHIFCCIFVVWRGCNNLTVLFSWRNFIAHVFRYYCNCNRADRTKFLRSYRSLILLSTLMIVWRWTIIVCIAGCFLLFLTMMTPVALTPSVKHMHTHTQHSICSIKDVTCDESLKLPVIAFTVSIGVTALASMRSIPSQYLHSLLNHALALQIWDSRSLINKRRKAVNKKRIGHKSITSALTYCP